MNWIDNPITRILSRVCDFVVLNILWIVCSLPIITIGASTSALYSVMLKLVKNEEGYIARGFLKGFKDNFKKSTIIWLMILLVGGIVILDLKVVSGYAMGSALKLIFRVVLMFVGFITICVNLYAFPLTARYENTVKQTIKNAVILSVVKLPYTVLMLVISIGPVVLTFLNVKFLGLGIIIWLLIGVALSAWLNSYLLRRVFTVFGGQEEQMEEFVTEQSLEKNR